MPSPSPHHQRLQLCYLHPLVYDPNLLHIANLKVFHMNHSYPLQKWCSKPTREIIVSTPISSENVTFSQLLPIDMNLDDKPKMVPHPIGLTFAGGTAPKTDRVDYVVGNASHDAWGSLKEGGLPLMKTNIPLEKLLPHYPSFRSATQSAWPPSTPTLEDRQSQIIAEDCSTGSTDSTLIGYFRQTSCIW